MWKDQICELCAFNDYVGIKIELEYNMISKSTCKNQILILISLEFGEFSELIK